nr:hypothetical protein Iba_chr12eCG0330 [Ipomoea batatas]GME01609.1 hypothetical protein Iba_scaffold1678430CG0010 [Ipomoea batatas]
MEGSLSILHAKRILETLPLSSYLMKVVLITNTMNIGLVKRKRLCHKPLTLKLHKVEVQKLLPQV